MDLNIMIQLLKKKKRLNFIEDWFYVGTLTPRI